jgi:hypothetical protein
MMFTNIAYVQLCRSLAFIRSALRLVSDTSGLALRQGNAAQYQCCLRALVSESNDQPGR